MGGGFSQYKVLSQTPSNVLGHRLWNFTDQLKGSNPKANPLFFCSFHSPWPLLLSESLFISICLSLPPFQTHLSVLFLSLTLFFLFFFYRCLQSSYCSLWFSYSLHLCPCLMRPRYIFSSPSALFISPSLFISCTLSLLFCLRERDQNVCWRNRASSLFTPHYYCFTQPHWGTRSTYS